jgi:2-methylcitrate dehydratase PrpD
MAQIEVCPDDELSQHYPQRWPARVDVVSKSGRTVTNLVLDAPGDPARPLGETATLKKFHRLADSIIGCGRAEELAQACLASIERIDALARLRAWINT